VGISSYEDVTVFPLDDEDAEQILLEQNECSFVWGTKEHWPIGVIMNYVWRQGRFWLTATSQRARIRAIERDERVSIIVSSVGLARGAGRSLTVKGRVRIHDDAETKAWFYPELARAVFRGAPDELIERFVGFLDSERRLVLEVTPEKWITYDASKMMSQSLFPDA
jgi:nitroimidazol reductase NimA-like FMN-containing flavoprotein (pyridoxamine 5'-phosphate oxidase superfamily)